MSEQPYGLCVLCAHRHDQHAPREMSDPDDLWGDRGVCTVSGCDCEQFVEGYPEDERSGA